VRTPKTDSAGFGFRSRGAHELAGQGPLFLKVAAEMALEEPNGWPRGRACCVSHAEPRLLHSTAFSFIAHDASTIDKMTGPCVFPHKV
jgi:hypothetical protein